MVASSCWGQPPAESQPEARPQLYNFKEMNPAINLSGLESDSSPNQPQDKNVAWWHINNTLVRLWVQDPAKLWDSKDTVFL